MAKHRRRKSKDSNRAGKLCISLILLMFVAGMSAQIIKVYAKDQEYAGKQVLLEQQLAEEEERQAEIEEYEQYIQSRQYVEDIAKSKLGLLYDNEIVFREQN